MHVQSPLLAVLATVTSATAHRHWPSTTSSAAPSTPTLKVPACPAVGTVVYNRTVPDLTPFPKTEVDVCYDSSAIHMTFKAFNEQSYYYNASLTTNDEIYNYEVMEAFIYKGTEAPQTYLEFEVAPNNVTYNAFVYNPSKVRAPGAPFDHFFITDPLAIGLNATTVLNRAAHTWFSSVRFPLGLFNVDNSTAKGTEWRMNFFRTVTSPSMYPNQTLGGWSPPNEPSFHITPYFGHVYFV